MKTEFLQVGILGTNFYVITDEETGISAAIDPGADFAELEPAVKDKNIKYILITHGHYDHVFGAAELKRRTGAEIVIGEADAENLHNIEKCNSGMRFSVIQETTEADITAKDGDEISVGNIKIKVMETPGHSMGSVCYIVPDENVIFSGDTLFSGSIGRTDFPTSEPFKMRASLKKLAELDGDYKVFPGHGRFTTLDTERRSNYYLR